MRSGSVGVSSSAVTSLLVSPVCDTSWNTGKAHQNVREWNVKGNEMLGIERRNSEVG